MKKKLYLHFMLVLILLSINIMPLQAVDSSDQQKISLFMNAIVKEVLQELESQTHLTFFYSSDQINTSRRVKISLENSSLEEALDLLFENTDVTYHISGNQILLKKKEVLKRIKNRNAIISTGEGGLHSVLLEFSDKINLQSYDMNIKGKVTDENGEGLPGVNVLLQGTGIGTVTDIEGNYSLTVPDGSGALVFSFIGYTTEEIIINNQSTINVSLLPDIQSLMEVVVVGYGEQKKADVTGATSTITSENFNTGVINNPLQAVQGKVAGLNISSANSDPTGNRPVIRLRGIGSLTASSEPLIVIDGVLGASLNSVAPEDIAKYDVLKDASATAIYGSRGANGVIIITTKRGTAGKTIIDYSTYLGISSPANKSDVLSPEEYFNKYNELNPGDPSTSLTRTDWFDEITRTALSHNHSLAISGGSEDLTYRGSIAYLDQPGIALNSGYDRLNTRLNLTQRGINDRLEVQLNLSANLYNKDFIDYNAFTRAARYSPLLPIKNPDGSYYAPGDLVFDFQNPVSMLEQETRKASDKQILGNLKLSFEVVQDLKVGVNASYSVFNTTYGYFRPRSYFDRNDFENTTNVSYGERSTNEVHDRLMEYTLQYNKAFGRHNIGAIVGYTFQSLSTEGFHASGSDFPDRFSFYNLAAADQELTRDNLGSYRGESRLDGVLARVNYSYADKYLLTANFRRDGSSRFGENNRYGYFPSVSVGWIISREDFMANLGAISFLKLRAGFGITGNQNGINDYSSRLLFGARDTYASPTGDATDPLNYKTAYFFSQNANPDLQWETSAMANVGIDFGLLDNRLSGSIDVYHKETNNLLYTYSVPIGDKYGDNLTYVDPTFLANIGTMTNKGIELALDYLVIEQEDFQWNTNFNIAHNKNEVVDLSGEGLTFPEEGIRNGVIYAGTNGYGPYAVLKEGLSVGTFWAPKEVGLNEAGQPIYEVINEETGEVSETTTHGEATRQDLGSAQPKITMGWTNNLSYKNFDLSIFIRSSLGQKVYNASNMVFNNPTTFRAGDLYPLNIFTSTYDGDNAKLTSAGAVSSRYVEDASFVRLDNVSLGYNFKLNADWIRNLRVYVAGQNLLTLTKYSGLDPEPRSGSIANEYGSVNSGDNLAFGLDDFFFYPRARTITIGLSAGF